MKRAARLLPWIFGFSVATLLFAILSRITYFRYENSDDILIVKSFMGFEGGVPSTFQLYQHTFLSHFLGWISRLYPLVPWFSVFQLGCLWFSLAVISKSLCDFIPNRLSLVARICLSGIFAVVFASFSFARINFTTTAAMLGAASVICFISSARKEKLSLFSIILSILLLLCCYMLRAQSCLASFPFWILALGYVVLHRIHSPSDLRRLCAALLGGVVVFIGLYGIRAFELRNPKLQELIHFQDANAGPMDYAEERLRSVSDEVLEEIGWTRSELALVQQWYFMDENITPEAFETLDAALTADETFGSRLSRCFETLSSFYNNQQRYVLSAGILLLLALVAILASRQRSKWPILPLAALGTILLTAALLFYLAFQGRFLSRAADCALFPAAAFLCGLAADSLDSLSTVKRTRQFGVVLLVVLCLGCTVLHTKATVAVLSDRPDQVSATREAALEAYALQHPEKLILRTPNLLRDTRLLPDVSSGLPTNIMIWGDWYCRTPSWYYQLESLGFDGYHFTAADFLNENLLFATELEAPPKELMTYLREFTGQTVTATLVDMRGDIRFFQFQ